MALAKAGWTTHPASVCQKIVHGKFENRQEELLLRVQG
jgi:hypothetical protein